MSNPIGWCTKTWSPFTGCTPVSPGCDNCWARRMASRLRGRFGYPEERPFRVTVHEDRFDKPYGWKKPQRIFVCSMGDLFHPDIQDFMRGRVMATAQGCPQHTFLILTKQPRDILTGPEWPKNIWLGVSVENQEWADKRIPMLLKIPAAKRFVCIEPMLGPVDMSGFFWTGFSGVVKWPTHGIQWTIVSCESGPKRRPCKLEWIRDIVFQCKEAEVPVYIKQLDIDGKVVHDIEQFPKDLQIREIPE